MTHATNDWNNDRQSRFDRLVTGELPEDQRRELFDWCNENPIRWRQCALAFLEAQCWRHGIVAWSEESIPTDSIQESTTMALPPHARTKQVPGWRTLGALAVSVAIAFIAGLLVRDPKFHGPFPSNRDANLQSVAGPQPDGTATAAVHSPMLEPTYVTVSVRTNLNPEVPGKLQIPVTAPDKLSPTDTGKREMSDYVRKQWEKRGYQVAETQRYLNAKLPDGRDVVLPVNGLEVKFVGKPVY